MANFTQKAIKESFIKLLNEKPLNKISVKDIVEECGINRNSFYYHFQDIPTLIEEIITEEADELLSRYPTIDNLEDALQVAVSFTLNNKKAALHIYNSVSRDVLERYLLRNCEQIVRRYFETAFKDVNVSEEDSEIAIRMVKCLLFGQIIDWIESGLNEELPKDAKRICDLCKGIPEEIIERSMKS